MKIFSKHRKKIEAHRRYGSREFKERLNSAKNYKRLSLNAQKGYAAFFSKTGLSKAGTFAAVLIIGGVLYFLTLSPYFRITDITVSGNSQVSTEEITGEIQSLSTKRFFLVPENSFFLMSKGRVSKIFAQELPEIREVKSHRIWPNKLSLEVTERTPAVAISSNLSNYILDDQGFVMKETADPEGLFLIVDQINEDIKVGEIIRGKLIPFIISVQNQWPGKIVSSLTTAKIPGKGASEVEFVSSEGWSVFFSTDRSAAGQITNLSQLLAKLISPQNRLRLAYVDLRLSKWAYYCYKESPCQQTDQGALGATAAADTRNDVVVPED